jgi:hypothetical protein
MPSGQESKILFKKRLPQWRRFESYLLPLKMKFLFKKGEIWSEFHNNNIFVKNTNFTETEVTSLVQVAQPHITMQRCRRSKMKSSWPDAILCYLSWAKFGFNYNLGAQCCRIKEGRYNMRN